jgi:hypothetical protein
MRAFARAAVALLLIGAPMCAARAPTTPQFVFQNNFWMNLHQFLRGEVYRRGALRPLGMDPATLDESERSAWASAMDRYVDVAKQNLIFDERARRIANTLATVGDTPVLPGDILEASATRALNAAAPVYRARIWPTRQRDNGVWAASAQALLTSHREMMASAVAKAYGVPWPHEPYLVDIVGEVGPNSAVTHAGPPGFAAHIQVSAASTRNTGDAPLELIFHEASHAATVESRIMRMIEQESARQKLVVSPDLWHYAIMFTTGEIARRELARTGHHAYAPYAERYDQIPRAERVAFQRDWLPYLSGSVSLDRALHDLIRDAR